VIPAPTTATRTARILPVVPGTPHDEVRPIVARLSSILEELGDDVEVEHHADSIAYSRGRRFAFLEPAPKRVDVGLVLPDTDETERLRPAAGDGITHRVSLAHEDEIDGELVTWLRDAYTAAAP